MNIEEGKGTGGYPVSEGRAIPRGPEPLCCGGLGVGWVLFILGFFFGVFPWFIGALLLCRLQDYDRREKSGFKACAIAAALSTIVIVIAVVIALATN